MAKKTAFRDSGRRVVRTAPDRSDNKYNHTSKAGTSQRTKATVRYIDKHEEKQMYTIDETGQFRETDRHEAAQRIEDTESKYTQHMVYTTVLDPEKIHVDEREYAEQVAQSVKEIRPDADIYAVSVHTDTDELHAHVSFGTDTVVRCKGENSELDRMRQDAYKIERQIEERGREADRTPEEKRWIDDQQQHHQQQARQQATYTNDERER